MNKYLVQISAPEVRELLEASFERVGKPESLTEFLIVQTNKDIANILSIDGVISAELDEQAQLEYVVQENAPQWGLAWIANDTDTYSNPKSGEGVDIYVIDSGVREVNGLAGRVENLYSWDDKWWDIVGPINPTHGTSVAACAAGTKYGTAKSAKIINCRSNFLNTDILKAVDNVLRHHLEKPDNRPSILNFSGSTPSIMMGEAFARLVDYGIVVVASGGNESLPQPRQPAFHYKVTSVGGLNESNAPAWFTNRFCDVYGPAQDIRTSSVFAQDAEIVISGTSFSCPYYAGLLACLLDGSDKFNSWQLATDFTFKMRNQRMETGRIADFPNGGLPVRTMTNRGLGGVYYTAPSMQFTDQQIADWVATVYDTNPRLIADVCKQYNLSLSRLARIVSFPIEDINQYFADAGIKPWWV